MPQMSPMNWLIISLMFITMISMMFTLTQEKTLTNSKTIKIFNKTLKWKW